MTNYEIWKAITESFQGTTTLGLSRPQAIGGPVGSRLRYAEDFGEDEDEDFDDDEGDEDFGDEEDDEYDGQQTDDGEDEDGMPGDLVGSTHPDDGPDKNWPPDAQEEEDDLPTPDQAMAGADDFGDEEADDDFLSSIGAGAGGEDVGPGPDMGGMDNGSSLSDDELANLSGLGGDDMGMGGDMGGLDALGGDVGGLGGDDMGGLDDLGGMGDDMGGMGGNAQGLMGEPCPDCNPDGTEEVGMEGCPSCGGMGFLDDEGGMDDLGGMGDDMGGEDLEADPDLAAMSSHMARYMQKYMSKHMKKEEFDLNPNWDRGQMQQPMQQPVQQSAPMAPQMPAQAQQMKKKMVSFMSKKGMKKFMAADAPRKYMRKDDKKSCCREDTDFFASLVDQARGTVHKKKTVREDSLLAPQYDEPQAGSVGFAPQSRVGGIGGGYTKADFADIPVLGESTRYPTLNEYAAWKARRAQKAKRR